MIHLYDDGEYRVLAEEIQVFWRWQIYRGEHPIQEGVSLSQEAARRASRSALSYFKQVDPQVKAYLDQIESGEADEE